MAKDKKIGLTFGRSRRRDKNSNIKKYALIGILVISGIAGVTLSVRAINANISGGEASDAINDSGEVIEVVNMEPTRSPEEVAAEELAAQKQAVVDTYSNIGIAQVSGYVNIRDSAGPGGEIIGKLEGDSACDILGEEGDWLNISSGGITGYVSGEFVVQGEEAKQLALSLVEERAIILTEKLNVRLEPVLEASNVMSQVHIDERYLFEEVTDGWIKLEQGYVSAEYVSIEYALNEAKRLDLRMMAVNQYDNIVISKVSNYLNVREEPSTEDDGNIIGKFPGNAAGEILETLDGWYKIKSGDITGYVTADPEFVAVGQEARDIALEKADLMAIVKVDKLNVRTEPSTDVNYWTQISIEERYPVVSQLDGWVEIELDSGDDGEETRSYVSTQDNYVEVRYALNEAIKFSPLEELANEQNALRTKVVNYGLQFVGNRYVWGGTNPNTGADCSGFVQYVLRNAAGVSLPRVSRDQAKSGRAITSDEMRPGDLIFYKSSSGVVNHVAMYIGNGQIVHAANASSGIKISTWNYRTPSGIRNVID